ncbi:hypothetical protein [Citreimonas sp.]|uniref:hypothetical protein n=1 Tax=Citreimonas sp. TaxID=3036715 RepID=UPI0035C7DF93
MALISHSRGFVFIKVPKTAGTSIEADLAPLMGPEDVVTPIIPTVPGHEPRNHLDANGKAAFFNHMPAKAIRDRIGAERFAAMTVFCVEREPVEKCISQYHMLQNSALHNEDGRNTMSWDEYCEVGNFPVSHGLYSEWRDGAPRLMADHVLRYDRLARDLPALLADLGLPGFRLTSRAKAEYSTRVLVRPQDVTPRQRRAIYDAFAQTLAVTGLDWDAPA